MSARPTGTRSTGAVVPNVATAPSEYVEFYMGGIWEWTPDGIARVYRFLQDLNVDRPTYSFEQYQNTWKVRCPRKSALYIRRNFCRLLSKIEEEYMDALDAKALHLVLEDGTLPNEFLHTDVRLPIALPRIANPPVPQSDMDGSVGDGTSHNGASDPTQGSVGGSPRGTVSLVVPDELRDARHIIVWQDLQAKHKDFEGTFFMSPAARVAIECAYGVKIVVDLAQKVIFIGNAASFEAALQVKLKLSKLLHEYNTSRRVPLISHHFYFAEFNTPFTIDAREISWLNPVLARSTIFDPWKFLVPEQYAVFDNDVCALRICRFAPLKNGVLNKTWSLFGPYAPNVFDGQKPRRSSRFFDGLRAARHHRAVQHFVDVGAVSNWLEELSVDPTVADAAKMTTSDTAATAAPAHGDSQDAPIPLNFDPSIRDHVAAQTNEPSPLPGGKVTTKPQPVSLLDQQDVVLRDPYSTMQRAMKPSQRVISVDDPNLVEVEVPAAPLPDQSKPILDGTKKDYSNQELEIFAASIGRLMEHIRGRYGVISLRAELGRFLLHNLPANAQAANQENQPADGWQPEDFRTRLEVHKSFVFTKALSSWGNDADFIGAGVWQPETRAVFFDFHFRTMWGLTPLDLVLEVNAEDYSWNLRFLKNRVDEVYVHCLAHHWDFQVALTYDRHLEYGHNWAKFAEALIESLDVRPPELQFQHTFEAPVTQKGSTIVIQDVRARQVCRFLHRSKKTYLDITRILPTQNRPNRDPKYRTVRGVLSKSTAEDPCAGDNKHTGEFAQWFEASVSSVRLEELLRQNEELLPGDEVDWTVQQINQEGLLADLYVQAAEVVKGMDGVGVECDNGHELRKQNKAPPKNVYQW